MDVGCPEPEFPGAGFEEDAFGSVDFLELFGYDLGAVGRGIVDDD